MFELLVGGQGEQPVLAILLAGVIVVGLIFLFHWKTTRTGTFHDEVPDLPVEQEGDMGVHDRSYRCELPYSENSVPLYTIPSVYSSPEEVKPVNNDAILAELLVTDSSMNPEPDKPIEPEMKTVSNPANESISFPYYFSFGQVDGVDVNTKLDHFRMSRKTGGGKCLEENEFIFLANGEVVPAKELIGKTRFVVGVNSTSEMKQKTVIASFSDNGCQPIIEITLDNGVVLKRTSEHPFWAANMSQRQNAGKVDAGVNNRNSPRTRAVNSGWVKSSDLVATGNRPHFDGHVILCPKNIDQKGSIRVPDSDVVICATLLAEGCLTVENAVKFSSKDDEIISEFDNSVMSYGCTIHKSLNPNNCDYLVVRSPESKLTRNPINALVKKWGMNGHSALTKKIPNWVFTMPNDQVAKFLQVFFDCDGWVDDGSNRQPSVNIALANEYMVKQIGQLAMRFGITGTIRSKKNSHAGCTIWSTAQVDTWRDKIGLIVKKEALDRAVNNKFELNESAKTVWNEWRTARPVENQTFADCPDGYEWRKIVSINYSFARTVSITVHNQNHAYIGYAVEHNTTALSRIIVQLIKQGVEVWYINPKYMPVDLSGVNLTPIIQRCTKVAIGIDGKDALLLLEQARTIMFQRIQEARMNNTAFFKPIMVIVDELSSLEIGWKALEDEKTPKFRNARKRGENAIDLLLRWGRQPHVFYGTTSQDAQAQNGPTNTGTAGNFGFSACHPSLDRYSLLNIIGDRKVESLPKPTSPYQWWAVTANPTGVDDVTLLSVPALSNEWIAEMLQDVPLVDPSTQGVELEQTDSSMNQKPKMAGIAADMMAKWNGGTVEQNTVPLPSAEQAGTDTGTAEQPEQAGTEENVPVEPLKPEDADVIRATLIWKEEPGISNRELARRLWGKGDGRWNAKAGSILTHIRSITNEANVVTAHRV